MFIPATQPDGSFHAHSLKLSGFFFSYFHAPPVLFREGRMLVIIELQRGLTPKMMQQKPCAICEVPFRVGSVVAYAVTDQRSAVIDERIGLSAACPERIAYLGSRSPSAFPTLEDTTPR